MERCPGRLSDYLSLGVVTRVFGRDLVDEVVAEIRRKECRSPMPWPPPAKVGVSWSEATLTQRVGGTVLVGERGRAYLPVADVEALAAYDVPGTVALEDAGIKHTTVWRPREAPPARFTAAPGA